MEITPAPAPPRRDLTIRESVLPIKITLLPNASARTGTPLTYEHNGWRPIKPGEIATLFAAEPGNGCPISACKAMLVDTHVRTLQVGRVSIENIENVQQVYAFVNDPAGPYLALTPSVVLLG